jgi:glycosyltransferase involved in cell wall biosynthesis
MTGPTINSGETSCRTPVQRVGAGPGFPVESPVPASRISVCIVCRNEADRLGPCLESVSWADEVIVMDLESTDDSVALATRNGAQVLHHEPVPIVEFIRNEVSAHATGDWILALDPDERVTPGLAAELRRLSVRSDLDAVVIPRMNYDLGFPPSHPVQRYEPQLRMYRRAAVSWPTIPNALPKVPEDRLFRIDRKDELVLVHERSRSIPEVLERSLRYAPLQAQSMIDRGQVFSARAMLATLWEKAYRQFIKGRAFHDGVPGVLRATILVAFHLYVWAAFWQLSGGRRTEEDDRLLRRIGDTVETLRRGSRIAGLPYRAGRTLLRRLRRVGRKHV